MRLIIVVMNVKKNGSIKFNKSTAPASSEEKRLLRLYSQEDTFISEVSPFIRLLYEPPHLCAQSDQTVRSIGS